jgi:hypothetical protein
VGLLRFNDIDNPPEPSMNDPTRKVDPAAKGRPLFDEADIGSGEKSPGEAETEEMIRGIPALPPSGGQAGKPAADTPARSRA